jgi:hypothetical protein
MIHSEENSPYPSYQEEEEEKVIAIAPLQQASEEFTVASQNQEADLEKAPLTPSTILARRYTLREILYFSAKLLMLFILASTVEYGRSKSCSDFFRFSFRSLLSQVFCFFPFFSIS